MMKTMMMLGVLALASCTGVTARQEVLMPTMERVYGAVIRPLSARGGVSAVVLDEFGVGLSSGDRLDLRLLRWVEIRGGAIRGIADRRSVGEIGIGVARSFEETLRLFDGNMQKLGSR